MKQSVIIIAIAAILCVCLCFVSTGSKERPAPALEAKPGSASGDPLPNGKNPYALSIFYDGKLYDDMGFTCSIPKGTVPVGTVTEITETPDSELEASFGRAGDNVYVWQEDGITWLGVEIVEHALDYWNEPHAFALEIDRDEEEIERIERRKKWFSVN